MNLTIKQLTPELVDDYFDFFENRAFTDDPPYRCYCQNYQLTKEQYDAAFGNLNGADPGSVAKEIARRQIESGILGGYLAYDGDVSIGCCNANDKVNFPVESCIGTHFHAPAEKREKAVICFEIAPEYRGKGVATALLQRVLADATAGGYTAVEGFPVERSERYEWDNPGPVRLYEKLGFCRVAKQDGRLVMRKLLK